MARTSNFANLATISRASKKWDPQWDFTSGGTVGTLTEFAANVAAVGPTGLLIEDSASNELENSRFEGATTGAIGSGGVMPTDMDLAANGGLTWTIDSIGTENGWPFMQLSATGTWSSDARIDMMPVTSGAGGITAASGETWTGSLGIKVVSGSIGAEVKLANWERTSAGSTTVDNLGADVAPGSTHKRYFLTDTLSGGTTGIIIPVLYFDNPAGTVSFTIRIYAPQWEERVHPTSPILPPVSSPAVSTRSADTVTVAAGAWMSDEPYTAYVEFQQNRATSADYVFTLEDGAAQDYAALYLDGTNAIWFAAENNASIESKTLGAFAGIGSTTRVAVRQELNNFAGSINGGTQVTDTSWTLPTDAATELVLGASAVAGSHLHGYIKDFRFWPRALTNAELEALVGN